VLIGRGPVQIPSHPAIVPLGFVSEQDKFDALTAAELLIAPSLYESLSMTVLEAWLMGKPVLVNGHCEVLREQCLRSNGGLSYRNFDEFANALDLLVRRSSLGSVLGKQGQRFARDNYAWSTIERKYLIAIERLLARLAEG
jgi:glycosyltransferase involved in cell wall biosynthesis